MTLIKARVIDSIHLELEEEIPIINRDILIRIVERQPITLLQGAWGYDIDSAEFVEKMRRSKKIDPL